MANDNVRGWRDHLAQQRHSGGRLRHATAQPSTHGIVLAGVHAWGDCMLESVIARTLLPIGSQPLIRHILHWIRDGGILEASICGNSDTPSLQRCLGGGRTVGVSLAYSEDVMPRGPAGCARDAALATGAETFVVVDGTILPRIDLTALLDAHARSGAGVTLAVTRSAPTGKLSGEVQEPVGICVFSRAVLEAVPASGYQDIKEALIPYLHRRGERIATHEVPANSSPRVTDAASYLSLNMWALRRMAQAGAMPERHRRIGQAWVASSATVHPTADFVGPALVGPRCVIKAGAMIVGPTTLGQETTVEAGAAVCRSAVWDRCRIGRNAILDHCVLTDDAKVDAELVVRHTVRVAPRRRLRTLFGRLASHCWPGATRVTTAEDEALLQPISAIWRHGEGALENSSRSFAGIAHAANTRLADSSRLASGQQ